MGVAIVITTPKISSIKAFKLFIFPIGFLSLIGSLDKANADIGKNKIPKIIKYWNL